MSEPVAASAPSAGTGAARVTVVIPTFRRPASLRRCLERLRGEAPPFAWDVVVVDNDPDGEAAGDVAAAVEEWAHLRPDVPIRCVVEPTSGAAHARNRGIREAHGEVIAMLDDDVVPTAGWLPAVVAPVLDRSAAAAGGPVVLDPAVPRPRWFDDSAVGGYLTAHDLGDTHHDLDYFAELVVTANAAFRRDVLQAVGGFDPAFGPRGGTQLVCDDAHLTRQVLARGDRVVWVPDALVIHDLPASRLRLRWLLQRAWWQGRSDWRLERLELAGRRAGGRVAGIVQVGKWLRREMAARRAEGLNRPTVAVHAVCDLVRMMGRLWGIAIDREAQSAVAHSGSTK